MSSKGGVIKEFLVGLGYKVDGESEKKFKDSVQNSASLIKELVGALAVTGAAYAFAKWIDNTTGGLEGLYFQAKRAGSSVKDLQAFGFAASQMGSSAEQAIASAQNMYQWILNNPNAETLLRTRFGIQTRDKEGNLVGGPELERQVGGVLGGMPSYRQKQYADMMGIPLELRQALIQSAQFTQFQMRATGMMHTAGLDPQKSAENAHLFQNQLRDLGEAAHIAGASIINALVGDKSMGGAVERFTNMLLSHLPQIDRIISRLADAGIKGFGKILDYLATVDWDAVFARIEQFVAYLLPNKVPKGENPNQSMLYSGLDAFRATFLGDKDARDRYMRGVNSVHNPQYPGTDALPAGAGATRGVRNNNPGNLKYNKYVKGLGAVGEDEGGFAIFPSMTTGLNAIIANLSSYGRKGVNTPSSIAHRWSKTDQEAYTKTLAALFGGDPNKVLNMADPNTLHALLSGILRQENGGFNPHHHRPSSKSKNQEAATHVQQENTTHITVHGSSDPTATASAIGRELNGVNQRMTRNLRVAIS